MSTGPDAAKVAVVILAAGRSERFGTDNKLLESIGGEAMIRRTAEQVVAAGMGDVIVVTGHDADDVERALNGLPVRCARNATPWAGMGTSLATGANAVKPDAEAMFVVLGDMPRLKPETLTALLVALDTKRGRDIVVPVHDGKRGHPVLFAAKYFTRLCALSGDTGARSILKDHPERVVAVPVDDPGTLLDVDTPEDLRKT
ncbi:MAG: nucleotidyltransferase family protein [Rhodospirillales bacterium]|nr:nucleotidyltransferase family protein [Rhodospirillales bacterium]MBO6785465.1 nucleotidyltransferase family protein [Rhodospirillales bacterium]